MKLIQKPQKFINKFRRGGIYVVFPWYNVDTNLGFKAPLGHAMVISVNDKTGATRGSEYGRYGGTHGSAHYVYTPRLIAKDPSNPTTEELNKYAAELDKYYKKSGGLTQVYYVKGADENEMNKLMMSAEKNRPDSYYQNRTYNILDHNCGTYAADLIKKSMPWYKFSGFGPYSWGTPDGIAPYWGTRGSSLGIPSGNILRYIL